MKAIDFAMRIKFNFRDDNFYSDELKLNDVMESMVDGGENYRGSIYLCFRDTSQLFGWDKPIEEFFIHYSKDDDSLPYVIESTDDEMIVQNRLTRNVTWNMIQPGNSVLVNGSPYWCCENLANFVAMHGKKLYFKYEIQS